MDILKARKLLGEINDSYSDEQILKIIDSIKVLSLACINKIETKIVNEGISFLKNVPKIRSKMNSCIEQ